LGFKAPPNPSFPFIWFPFRSMEDIKFTLLTRPFPWFIRPLTTELGFEPSWTILFCFPENQSPLILNTKKRRSGGIGTRILLVHISRNKTLNSPIIGDYWHWDSLGRERTSLGCVIHCASPIPFCMQNHDFWSSTLDVWKRRRRRCGGGWRGGTQKLRKFKDPPFKVTKTSFIKIQTNSAHAGPITTNNTKILSPPPHFQIQLKIF